ncbi:MAG: DUF2804 domain-containing protein [Leptospiraceae bacterium]|nr:DUF2804 domain-containing protein [Leptospiraceae bacterium]MCP5510290.1 DUF2804 domain-containing protein [Leptospiraceae bacterium]
MNDLSHINTIEKEFPDFGRYRGYYPLDTTKWDGEGIFSLRRTKRKAWVFAGILTEEYIIGFAIVDAGIMATGFAYLQNRKTGKFIEEKCLRPLGFPDNYNPDLKSSWTIVDGRKSWHFLGSGNTYQFDFVGESFSVQCEAEEEYEGLSVVAPSKNRPFHYTYKNMNLKSKVTITHEGTKKVLNGNFVSIDFSKGYPPRETFWNWASLIGTVAETGDKIGINLVSGFNDGLENAVWLGGNLIPLGLSEFKYQKPISIHRTEIRTNDALLEIQFSPEGKRMENIDVVLYRSQFIQAFGVFEGKLLYKGNTLRFHGLGLVEEHHALW